MLTFEKTVPNHLPRTRGDKPTTAAHALSIVESTPHTRG